jgi:hypothetical protein
VKTSTAVGALVFLTAAMFVAYPLRGERFLCASAYGHPPWFRAPGGPPSVPADYTTSDQLVFMLPNDVHRARSFFHDLGGLFWNPHHLCGTPFLATLDTFALYPPSLLAIVLDPADVFFWTAALHVLIAALGGYAALGRLRLSSGARVFGAFAFAGGTWMIARLDYPNFPQTAAWTPWIFYASDRALTDRRTRDRALLAGAVLMSTLAGMIQLTAITLVAAAPLALIRLVASAKAAGFRDACRGAASAGFGLLIGLLLAAPQWLVTWDYAKEGSRVKAGLDDLRPRCVRPAEWLALPLPDLFGSGPEINRRTLDGTLKGVDAESEFPPAKLLGLRGADATFFESACAPFAVALVVVLAGGLRRRTAAGVGLVLLLFGVFASADSPLFALVHGAPGAAFGSPRRWLLLTSLGFAALAAAALDAGPTRAGMKRAAALPLILLIGWAALRLAAEPLATRLATASGAGLDAARTSLDVTASGIPAPLAFAVLAWASLLLPARPRGVALAALLAGQAALFQLKHNPGQLREPVFPPTETAAMLRGATPKDAPTSRRMLRVLGDDAECRALLGVPPTPHLLPANVPTIYGIRDVHGYEGVLDRRLEEIFNAVEPGVVHVHHHVGTFANPRVASLPLMRFLGVKHVLSQRSSLAGFDLRAMFPAERVAIFENAAAPSTETCVAEARVFEDDASLLRALVSPDFDPAREVLLLRRDATTLGLPEPEADGRIRLGDGAPDAALRTDERLAASVRMTVELKSSAPPVEDGRGRLFVFAETYDPGWSCVDEEGAALPLVRANHGFQAAYRRGPSPRRLVRDYRPRLWTLAVALAAAGLAALFVDSRVRAPAKTGAAAPPPALPTS